MVSLPDGTEIATARGLACKEPWQHKTLEQVGLQPVEGLQQLERLFADWCFAQ